MSVEYSLTGQHDYIPDAIREMQQLINPVVLDAYYHEACADFRATVFKKMLTHHALLEGTGWATFDLKGEEPGSIAMADGAIDVLVQATLGTDGPKVDGRIVPDITMMSNEQIVGLNGEQSFLTYVFVLSPQDQAYYGCDAFAGSQKEDGNLTSPYKSLFFFNEADQQLKLIYPGHANKAKARNGAIVSCNKLNLEPFGVKGCLEDKFYALNMAKLLFDKLIDLEPEHTLKDTLG